MTRIKQTPRPPILYNHTFYSKFRKKRASAVTYIRKEIPSRSLTNFEFKEFDVLWIKIAIGHSIKFFCIVYLPHKKHSWSQQFFNYLFDFHSNIQKKFSSSEIFLGNFNVHNKNWLKFSSQNFPEGPAAEIFSTACGLTQLINGPTRVPDKPNEKYNLLDLFITSQPSSNEAKISALLENSGHKLIKIKTSAEFHF